MILAVINKKPAISFGLGVTELEVSTGQAVTLWLDQIYNSEYSTSIERPGSITNVEVNKNKYTLTPTVAGSFDIYLKLVTPDKKRIINSNIITLTVV